VLLVPAVGPWIAIVCFVAVASVSLVSYLQTSASGSVGATTEIAALATFLLGMLAGWGELLVAAAGGVAVAVLLAAKPPLERFSLALTSDELSAVLELAVISVIVLPLLPDRGFGPWEALNPREIWLVVVLVCALSFAGFVAVRIFGPGRGLVVTGLAGGLVSSTAVTLSMAQRARAAPELAVTAAAGATLASAVMCLRVLFFGATIDARILPRLAPPVLLMAAIGAAIAFALLRRAPSSPEGEPPALANPFSLRGAISFALIYVAVLLAIRAGNEYLGANGEFVVAGVSSLADVDAVTIALTRAGPVEASWRTPAAAITLAAALNNLVKAAIALLSDAGRFRWLTAGALLAMSALGGVAGLVVYRAV
jgi:uncharacterized membrane protein (DUF4010 family)